MTLNGTFIQSNHISNSTLNIFNIHSKSIPMIKGDFDNYSTIFLQKFFKYNNEVNNFVPLSKYNNIEIDFNDIQRLGSHDSGYRYLNDEIMITQNQKEEIEKVDDIPPTRVLLRKSSVLSTTKEFMDTVYLKGTKSLEIEPDCPFIYSLSNFHPFSFMTGNHKYGYKKGKLTIPSPTFIENDLWLKKPLLTKEEILKGMIISDENGLILVDKEIKKKFRGIVRDLITQLIKAAFGHKITLNVKLFEPKSFLQRLTDYWSFLPKFFPLAANPEITPLERMKYIMAFAVSGLYIPTKQLKPFNPLITETFQGQFYSDEKTKVYLEQISNYPTVSRFLVSNKEVTMSGYFDLSVETESLGSKISVNCKGYSCIDFKTINEKIIYSMPTPRILNASSENKRSAFFINSMIFVDVKNNLKGVINFGKDIKCVHKIDGRIFSFNYPENYKFNFDTEKEFAKKLKFSGKEKKFTMLSYISGSWLKEFIVDGQKLWNIDEDIPYWIQPVKKSIPSDGRFREDLIWLYRSFYCAKSEKERLKYETLAQEWKLLIEKLQREERELKAKQKKIRDKK